MTWRKQLPRPTCNAMHRDAPHYECERVRGHHGRHAAFIGNSACERVEWTDDDCMHDLFAARFRDE